MITWNCDHDAHAACTGCDCGCHWLTPLAAGTIDRAEVAGRTWVRAT